MTVCRSSAHDIFFHFHLITEQCTFELLKPHVLIKLESIVKTMTRENLLVPVGHLFGAASLRRCYLLIERCDVLVLTFPDWSDLL